MAEMSSNTKKLIILTAGLLLFSLILGQIFGNSFPFGFLKNNTSFGGAKTFPVNGSFSKIEIESKTGNIRFYDSGSRNAKVVWSGSSGMKLSVATGGNTLKVSEKYKLPWFLRFGIHTGKSEIAVYLPQKNYEKLGIESDTGNIQIPSGLKFTRAEVETDTGSIDFQAAVSRELKIETDTGRINCAGVKPENLEIASDTGSIYVSSVRASDDIKLKTDTGRIALNNVTVSDKLEIKSDTGSISLERCDAEDIDIKTDTGSVSGTLLSGKNFSARSQTGKVSIPESTFGGSCRIQSDTGSITIRIEK